ncbi:hypothetical protein ACS0ZG_29860 [Burkholderia gladioli]|uniref:hypothetical protein n=1 Tax=Burkholderia gladioli TaxID=28095 RepID=UPI003F7A10F6
MSYSHEATPAWLWTVLLLVVWRAIRALQPKIMSTSRMLIFPALFTVWSVGNLEHRAEGHAVSMLAAIAALALGAAAGWYAAGTGRVRADHERRLIERPGGVVPLIVVLVSIGGKLLFFSGGAPGAMAILFSVLLLGLLWGRTLHYGQRYLSAPHTALNPAT